MVGVRLFSNLTSRSRDIYNSISKELLSSAIRKDLQKLHSLVITFGLHNSLFFSGNLISKYSQFKDPNSCLLVFRSHSSKRNAYLWNTIIRAMTRNGFYARALEFYAEMRRLEVKPDNYTFPSVINACGSLLDFEKGRVVHEHAMELGLESDLFISNALIDMYSRCNELGLAREVFDGMPHRDIVSWNSLISGYTSNGYSKEALEIYNQPRMDGFVPDSFSFSSVLLACGGLGEVERYDVIVSNGFLSMYFKFDMLANCKRIFDEMVHRDKVTWNTIICGYCESGLYEESIGLFLETVSHFEPDILTITSVLRACTYVGNLKLGRYVHDYMVRNGYECDTLASNIIINMYAKCGDLLRSREMFENMGSHDLVSWNSLLSGYVENRSYHEAVELFRRMKINFQPDFFTYVTLLSICAELIDINFTEELHCDIIKQGFGSTQMVGNALVDAYAKRGKMEDSLKQFENMEFRDTVTWNSIIASCGHSYNSNLGFSMLSRMRVEGGTPDIPTVLSALPLCSYLIAKQQGKEMHGAIYRLGFESNIPIGNALIEMYSNTDTIISSYGMYGEGRKALEAFEFMEAAGILPDHVVFVAIIYACSHSGLVQEGRACFEQMKKNYNLEPRLEHYACVVDLLSRSGLLTEAEEFIVSMPLKPDASIWGVLLSACRASGNMNIAERVSEHLDMPRGHSERLAIAFGLLHTKPGYSFGGNEESSGLWGLPHVTKYISKIMHREILVRDANRFHLFKNGTCSCRDHW
ncbi:hypothetical protein CDL12_02094 [Handroanthus impetiginosus]|uniref:DYW domain-containing protein n=1 Tax=Handroanthus impetiginosus TaxID=429701 RepID=A0A2G9I5W6_9LAMI|nr:hypothetical protein CDL12_02094 [Handroanthus impetiginosus]